MFLTAGLGNIFGFLAVLFIATSALFMLLRGEILKHTKDLQLVRSAHIGISALAGVFLMLHVGDFIWYPLSTGLIFGYVAFGTAVVVWTTGSAFLEKVRGSLLFHGSLSLVVVSLALIHAASLGYNLAPIFSGLVLVTTMVVVVVNLIHQLNKIS